MNNICKVVEDLLPLYMDDLTSEETNQFIEEHLKTCSGCKEKQRALQEELVSESIVRNEPKPSEDQFKQIVLKIRNRMMALLSGAIIMAILIGMFSNVYIFSVLAYVLLASSLFIFIWKVDGKSKKYWISAIFMYVFSALAGFSIGLYTVAIAFILFSLAIGHSFGKIKKRRHAIISIVIAIIIWWIVIHLYNGFWIFYPVIRLLELLLN
ncbi:zf-HC2 domain-containing protein [Oceanobacillus jeddahense]|uniref:Zf-HC2 domain-containing protein n=1 Tax=Oceanobacillus jeddahense TaxID=1462527 RepID=A0ABY5JPC0_9BACI|nr:zf-HC2 domain-containing protein [Oceanobacillus jeddahense]UUI02118.1 zf-HC2 domain-containing protein [Oceanobacillus jeddahense]